MDSRENAPLVLLQTTPAGTKGMAVSSEPPSQPQSPLGTRGRRAVSNKQTSTVTRAARHPQHSLEPRHGQSVTGFHFGFLNPFLSP